VVAQLLNETCDAGAISTTEPNALRDLVEVEGWIGKLLGGISIPGFVIICAVINPKLNKLIQETRLHFKLSNFQYAWHIICWAVAWKYSRVTLAKG
jgi:hypothetical protein